MNSKAFVVWFLLLAAVFAVTVVASVDDTKQAGENQVDGSKSSCKYGNCAQARDIPLVKEDNAKYELNHEEDRFDEVIGEEGEDESKYQGGRGSGQGGKKGGGHGQGGQKGGGHGQGGQKGKGQGGQKGKGGGQGGQKGGGGGQGGQKGKGGGKGGGGSGRGGGGGDGM
ncbi:hypothetical protein V5N11_001537 [Cardamine amara subsp. amara]|uniref:Glycine-rich protein n=1 Tax=Cardamine amara subsp. amara TaxID=228776 RepID=A0ABD0ZMQ7_CARAN